MILIEDNIALKLAREGGIFIEIPECNRKGDSLTKKKKKKKKKKKNNYDSLRGDILRQLEISLV